MKNKMKEKCKNFHCFSVFSAQNFNKSLLSEHIEFRVGMMYNNGGKGKKYKFPFTKDKKPAGLGGIKKI